MAEPIDADAIDDRLVLADLLIQRGDPLGELISVHHALEALPADAAGPKRRSLEAQLARILSAHHAALFGALAPHVQAPDAPPLRAPALEVTWCGGYADSASIESPGAALELADIYRALRRLPLARFLRRLEVGRGDYTGFMAALGADPAPALAELVLHGQTEAVGASKALHKGVRRQRASPYVSPAVDAVIDGGLFARLPALEVLRVQCSPAGLRALDAPALRQLTVWLSVGGSDGLARSALPSLEELSCFQVALTVELLERTPRLAQLSCITCTGLPEILQWIGEAPATSRLAHLRTLEASGCGLGDTHLAFLTAHADRFSHLEVLNLGGNTFSRQQAEAAIRVLPQLRVSDWILR